MCYLYAIGSFPALYCLYCFSKVPSGLCRTMGLSAAVVYRRTECCDESITLALSVLLDQHSRLLVIIIDHSSRFQACLRRCRGPSLS